MRSSSIIGGAHGFDYIVGILRVKVVALLLGPSGIGLIGLYQTVISLLSVVSSLGINSSGVREVASAKARGDDLFVARTVVVLRRACWATGLAGWAATVILSEKISWWVFGSPEHTFDVAVLGGVVLFTAVSGGQMAMIQGMRRIGDLVKVNITSMLINTILAIGGYAWLGMAGIVPVLLASAAVTLAVSWRYAQKLQCSPVKLTWHDILGSSASLATLGLAFMWAGLLSIGLDLVARSIITREYGVEAAGVYQAAWALSGMFAGFVLGAMAADFYPRLTEAIGDRPEAIRLVNEQIEIGLLLALPGLLATLALSPLIIRLLYTSEFMVAAALLPWFMLGVFGRVVSWPCGFIQLALGKGSWFLVTQTVFACLHLGLLFTLIPQFGLKGAAYAFAILYLIHVPTMAWVALRLLGFRWSGTVRRLFGIASIVVLISVVSGVVLSGAAAMLVGTLVTVVGTIISVRGMAERLGPEHQIVRTFQRIPGVAWIMHVGRG